MTLEGTLKDFALVEILQLLSLERKTGLITVARKDNSGLIYLKEGRVLYATVEKGRPKLGEILIEEDKITEEQLEEALDLAKGERGIRLGKILLELGYISRQDLEEKVREQIEESVYLMLSWADGYFKFEPGILPTREDIILEVGTDDLLMEGVRRIDEWSKIKEELPFFEKIFRLAPSEKSRAVSMNLTTEEWRVLTSIDSYSTVKALARKLNLDSLETARIIYNLLLQGLIEEVKR